MASNRLLRCIGCGLEFASSEAFDLHATGSRRAPIGAPRRCRTEAEMKRLGMHRTDVDKRWTARRLKS